MNLEASFGSVPTYAPVPFTYKDGTKVRIINNMGDVIITIVAPEEVVVNANIVTISTLIFLIQDATHYAVWKIATESVTLTPYNFRLLKYVTFWDNYVHRNPSTVKSNSKYNKHTFTIENKRVDVSYFERTDNVWPQYGMLAYSLGLPGGEIDVLIGVPNEYINDDTFNHSATFPVSSVICTSKHTSYKDANGDVISTLCVQNIDGGSGRIVYTKNGVTEYGSTIAYAHPCDIFAALSPDKYIGVDLTTWTYSNINEGSLAVCNAHTELGPRYSYLFGDVTLETELGTFTYNDIVGESVFDVTWCCTYSVWYRYARILGKMHILDYDNIQVDKSFICFYKFKSGYTLHEEGSSDYALFINDLTCVEYKIAYRANGGELKTEVICDLKSSSDSYSYIGETPCSGYLTPSLGPNFIGSRISDISCYANEKYLVYTYTLWNYTGDSGEVHFDDMDNTHYTFVSRILGIINAGSGKHTKHVITDKLLGKYADTFDKEAAAAIGIHKL